MNQTEEIYLDIDFINEILYKEIIKEFHRLGRDNIICVNDIKLSAIIEFEE